MIIKLYFTWSNDHLNTRQQQLDKHYLFSKTFAIGRVSMMLFMKKVDFFDYILQKLIHLGMFHIM